MLSSKNVAFIAVLFISLFGFFTIASPPIPTHLQQIKSNAIQQINAPAKRLLVQNKQTNQHRFQLALKQGVIDFTLSESDLFKSTRGFYGTSFKAAKNDWTVVFTQGDGHGFGEVFGNGQHLLIEQRGDQVVAVDIGLSGLTPGLYENDTVGDIHFSQATIKQATALLAAKQTGKNVSVNNDIVIVDLMLLYTPNIVQTFPGEMTQTLLEHLVFKANQTFFDSQINMRLRLVRTQFVNYTKPSSLDALTDMRTALDANSGAQALPALANIASLRDTVGADIVSMIRTHDLNEREVCGVAMFPDPTVDYLANVSNVGISGGSNCIDTFTHEIGHNFGAGHQRFNGQSVGAQDAAGALIVSGKFNTMMSSIGTGDINRDYGLQLFSNPNITCASVPCGDAVTANNAATINFFAETNAALRVAVSETPVASFFPSIIDRDGDSVFDNSDAFPFNALESVDSDLDGMGDNQDAFPNDPSEQVDTDLDGVGNNADNDDDDDQVIDTADDLPLNSNETIDNDGDGVGANTDELDNNFQEVEDTDSDNIGNRADTDDDNDGVPDFFEPSSLNNTEAWVVSASNDRILRFNGETGDYIAPLLQVETGGFSFRSDAILSDSQQLYYVSFSDVLAFDRQTNTSRLIIDRSELNTNFPAHLLFSNNDNLYVNSGLGNSHIQSFDLSLQGNFENNSASTSAVWRDMLELNNRLIVAQRDTNSLMSFASLLSDSPVVFASEGLDKPEHIALDASANLLVTNAGSKNISRFNSSGLFMGEFISAGSGGLGKPSCITIGPDAHVYVCSSDTNQILKYDGQSGAFLEIFIDSNNDNLAQPVSLVFAGVVLDEIRLSGEHDSDGDLVNNSQDAFPLDATETIDTDSDGIGNNADSDDDNDTMPDSYEIANNLNPLDASDAQLDNDNDGSTNLAEFSAGTNPNDASSVVLAPEPPEPQSSGGAFNVLYLALLWGLLLVRFRFRP